MTFFPSVAVPHAGEVSHLVSIAGAGEALLVAEMANRWRRKILLVTRDTLSAYHLAEELSFFAPELNTQLLPDWEVLPYDSFSPSTQTVSARVAALSGLVGSTVEVLVTAATTALFRLPPTSFIAARTFSLAVGDKCHLPDLLTRLEEGGYVRVERVGEPGEFAVYGGQVDVFPPEAKDPFRLVLMDDEIEQIRLFSAGSQRSLRQIKEFNALPASECDFSATGVKCFRESYRHSFNEDNPSLFKRLAAGTGDREDLGLAFMLPLFFEKTSCLFDYLSSDTVVLSQDGIMQTMEDFIRQTQQRREVAAVYENRRSLPVSDLFLSPKEFLERRQSFSAINFDTVSADTKPPLIAVNNSLKNAYQPLIDFLIIHKGHTLIAVDGEGRREALMSVLKSENFNPVAVDDFCAAIKQPLALVIAPLSAGMSTDKLNIFTEAEIFQTNLPPKSRRVSMTSDMMDDGDSIGPGDLVVHYDYGIGRCLGLCDKTIGGEIGEFFEIEYANEQRLWLPVAQMRRLCRHHGDAPLSKMGGWVWRRTRSHAEKNAHDTAARLLELNAIRLKVAPKKRQADKELLAKFAAGFVHQETPEQAVAVADVMADLTADKPMDRLLAADVGFGKTEVAMRAACLVCLCGEQTAVLAPTTLLAEQHARNFINRFANFPIRVASLTRMNTAHEKKALPQALAAGDIDIIIGTHALIQAKIKYKNLGLVVIDEEHRFGVRQKENFKSLRADVDILSLSATPIPRTLSMAVEGIRQLSVITTPPPSRLAVKTIVASFSREIIKEACEREMLRGGQIYFIHNEIRDMEGFAEQIQEWLPTARIVVAHGAMGAAQLEYAMCRFLRRQADVLLCTSIVESGLDIHNANTVIIDRADRMGISRLHQLRGRVGRSHRQAYAYFLIPPEGSVTKNAEERLIALRDYAMLGGGFYLAMRDLEIRGAGEILGDRQSGDLRSVGFTMYQKMLKQAAKDISGGESSGDINAFVEAGAPAFFPTVYISSVNERLRYYRLLADGDNEKAVVDVRLELEDRFGSLPAPALLLISCHRLRLVATIVAVTKVKLFPGGGYALIEFSLNTKYHDILLKKITLGVCAPTPDGGSVRLLNLSQEPLIQSEQVIDFLKTLKSEESAGNNE